MLRGMIKEWKSPKYVSEIFEETCNEHLNDVACFYEDETVTYKELNEASNRIARALLQQLNRYDQVPSNQDELKCIGIFMEPSYDRLVTITALLKLNIPYVPLDPVIPINRLKLILREAKPMCIVSSASLYDEIMKAEILAEGYSIYQYDRLRVNSKDFDAGNLSSEERFKSSTSNPLFCILYTSGSTGTPKGVRLLHSNVINRLNWQWNEVPFQAGDVGCAKTSLLFVDSITEMFGSLLKGVPVVIIPKAIVRNPDQFISILEKYKVTHLILVPSLLKAMFNFLDMTGSVSQLSKLRYVVSSGETLPVELAKQFFDVFPNNVTLANYYGSTEITGDVTFQLLRSKDDVDKSTVDGRLYIGKIVDNNNVYIVNKDLALTTGTGELLVSGLNVADGYIDTKNKANFLPNHLHTGTGHEYLYRTGDYARIVNEVMIYEGRTDSQVKIRGQKVNLGEVQNAISVLSGIQMVVVLLCTLGKGNEVIVAFCSTSNDIGEEIIKEACGKSLPDYMIPDVMVVQQFPLQPATGKIDRVGLRDIYSRSKNPKFGDFKFADKTTDDVMSVVSDVLGTSKLKLSAEVNFFELGGNSINAISVLMELKKKGYSGNVTCLLSALDINDFISSLKEEQLPSTEVLSTSVETEKYIVVPLTDVLDRKDEIIKCTVDAFVKKEPISISLGITSSVLKVFVDRYWNSYCKSGVSCVCLDKSMMKVLGVSLLITGDADVEFENESLCTIVHCLEDLESRVSDDPRITKNFADSHMLATSLCLSPQENLMVTFLLEKEAVELVKSLGYDGIITCNTSKVTQGIDSGYLGYETLGSYFLKDYETKDGRKPFASAPKDATVDIQVKFFN